MLRPVRSRSGFPSIIRHVGSRNLMKMCYHAAAGQVSSGFPSIIGHVGSRNLMKMCYHAAAGKVSKRVPKHKMTFVHVKAFACKSVCV